MQPFDMAIAGLAVALLVSLGGKKSVVETEIQEKASFFGLVISIIVSLLIFLGVRSAFNEKHKTEIVKGMVSGRIAP
jgi:predicted transporter